MTSIDRLAAELYEICYPDSDWAWAMKDTRFRFYTMARHILKNYQKKGRKR
jgi:hypothetical protein